MPTPLTPSGSLRSVLDGESCVDLSTLVDTCQYVPIIRPKGHDDHNYTGARGDFVLAPGIDRFSNYRVAYGVDGPSPTITTTHPVIYDARFGVFRRLSPKECMRVAGYKDDFSFPRFMTDSDVYSAVGKGFDLFTIRKLGESISTYSCLGPRHPLKQPLATVSMFLLIGTIVDLGVLPKK